MQEDGPDRGNVDLDILPRSVRYRLKDVIDDVRAALVHSPFEVPPAMLKALLHHGKGISCAVSTAACFIPWTAALQGRISKSDIDARMLKALADLPVDLGIEAIDKFAMASLDSIRSKTGFMVSL